MKTTLAAIPVDVLPNFVFRNARQPRLDVSQGLFRFALDRTPDGLLQNIFYRLSGIETRCDETSEPIPVIDHGLLPRHHLLFGTGTISHYPNGPRNRDYLYKFPQFFYLERKRLNIRDRFMGRRNTSSKCH